MHLDWNEEDLVSLQRDSRFGQILGDYEIVGFLPHNSGQTKRYVVKCSVCALDPELFGLGLFAGYYEVFVNYKACGCGRCFQYSEELQFKRIKRIVEQFGFKFVGFNEQYRGGKTKCTVECPKHGQNSNAAAQQIVQKNKPSCLGCKSDNQSSIGKFSDQQFIEKFMATGAYHENTIFYPIDRRSKNGKIAYWVMICGECGGRSELITSSFSRGVKSCDCGVSRQRQAYINLVYNGAGIPIALKFGIAASSHIRINQQNRKNGLLSRQYEVYEFKTKFDCWAAEREVKSSTEGGFLSKELFPDGYTETVDIKYLVEIQKIYKKYGGVSIMYIANETFSDGCVAFVESTVFGVNLAEDASPYFRTKEILKD